MTKHIFLLLLIVTFAFFFIGSFLLGPRISAWIASILCFFLGTALFFYVQRGVKEESIDPARALPSDQWETRVAALKLIEQKKLEVGDFEAYPRLMKSRHVAERYWFVRTLGSSRRLVQSVEAYRALRNLGWKESRSR